MWTGGILDSVEKGLSAPSFLHSNPQDSSVLRASGIQLLCNHSRARPTYQSFSNTFPWLFHHSFPLDSSLFLCVDGTDGLPRCLDRNLGPTPAPPSSASHRPSLVTHPFYCPVVSLSLAQAPHSPPTRPCITAQSHSTLPCPARSHIAASRSV